MSHRKLWKRTRHDVLHGCRDLIGGKWGFHFAVGTDVGSQEVMRVRVLKMCFLYHRISSCQKLAEEFILKVNG